MMSAVGPTSTILIALKSLFCADQPFVLLFFAQAQSLCCSQDPSHLSLERHVLDRRRQTQRTPR
jgi:hypothetical protein